MRTPMIVALLVVVAVVSPLFFVDSNDVEQPEQYCTGTTTEQYQCLRVVAGDLVDLENDFQRHRADMLSIKEAHDGEYIEWPDEVRKSYVLAKAEARVAMLRHEGLVGYYNSDMARLGWVFTDPSRIPDGNLFLLPREFRPLKMDE